MKNKHTVLIAILCIITSFIYISDNTYNNKNTNFTIDIDKNENLNQNENTNLNNNIESIDTLHIDKNKNNIQNNNKLININTANKETLKTLPGIGDVLAENIINYRENVSLFNNISDIKNVDHIGEKTFEKIKNLITVD